MKTYLELKQCRSLLFIIIFLLSTIATCQINENNKLPTYNPPSPKSFEFLKYGEIPVGKYNGLPNISVPLYTIKAKGIEIPINLSYHAGGFRVSEEAGMTGLGWSLSGGGSVVQIINGFDDLGGAVQSNRSMPDFEPIFDAMTYDCSICPPGSEIYGNCRSTLLTSDGKHNNQSNFAAGVPGYYYIPIELFSGQEDYEPDVFKFNMPGYSGEFIIDWKNENYHCLTDNKIKIVPSDTFISGSMAPEMISILVPEGHKFVFRMMEETKINLNASQNELNPNQGGGIDMTNRATSRSYQLISIVTNQGEQISYSYTVTEPIKNFPSISKSVVRYSGITSAGYYPFPSYLSDNITSYSYTQQPYSYINKISYTGGEVYFTLSDRTDLVGSKKLDRIEVKTLTTPKATVKTFNFNYDYFIGNPSGTNYDQYNTYNTGLVKTETELTNRLKLLSVAQVGENPYVFEYNSEPLPKKTSWATDYWGFYNGVMQNQTPFVNIHAFGIEITNPLFNDHDNNNKGSSLKYTKASVLEKIIYPTKGYTTFNYELNSFDNTGTTKIPTFVASTRKSVVVHSRGQDGAPIQNAIMFEEDSNILTGGAYLSTFGCSNPGYENNNTYIKIEVYKKELIPFLKAQPNYNTYGLMYVLAMTGIANGSNAALRTQYLDNEFMIMKNGDLIDKTFVLNYIFNKGVVVFSSSGGCGEMTSTTNNSQAYMTLSYDDYAPFEAVAQGAGLRVKEIVSYIDGMPQIKKGYNYFGGKKMSALNFYNATQVLNYDWMEFYGGSTGAGNNHHSSGWKHTLNTNSFIPISSSASGANVGYDVVEEKTINTQPGTLTADLGRIVEYYINTPDSGILSNMNYAGEREYRNGLVNKQEVFDNNNNLVQSTVNSYSSEIYDCSYGMKQNLTSITQELQSGPGGSQVFFYYHHYDIGTYPLQAYKIKLDKVIKNEYANNQVMSSATDYSYNGLNQQIYSKNTNSNNDITESYSYYPSDLLSVRTDAASMNASNIFAPVLRKELKVNNDLIQSEEFEYYKRLGSNNNFLLPDVYSVSKYKSAKGTDLPETKAIYTYDDLGNALDVYQPEGIRTAYIWGYNKQYVIAKIENSSYSGIPTNLLNSAVSASNSSITGTEADLKSALAALRAGLPNAFVSTFTYEPLTGVKIITDPKSESLKYFYQNGKLVKITDDKDNILNEYKYNFAQ